MSEKAFKEFIENDLKLILKEPLNKAENAVLLSMCRIVWNNCESRILSVIDRRIEECKDIDVNYKLESLKAELKGGAND